MGRKIIGYSIAVFSSVAAVIFGRHPSDLIPYPYLWLGLSIVLIILGLYIAVSGEEGIQKLQNEKLKKDFEEFIRNADKIEVNLEECTIKTNNYVQEYELPKNYKSQALDAIYDETLNVKRDSVNQAVLVFKMEEYESKKYYSPIIYKDESTIKFLVDKYKTAWLYIDKLDRSKYYFVLPF